MFTIALNVHINIRVFRIPIQSSGVCSKDEANRPFHIEIGKFQNIHCVNHGEEVNILARLRC